MLWGPPYCGLGGASPLLESCFPQKAYLKLPVTVITRSVCIIFAYGSCY